MISPWWLVSIKDLINEYKWYLLVLIPLIAGIMAIITGIKVAGADDMDTSNIWKGYKKKVIIAGICCLSSFIVVEILQRFINANPTGQEIDALLNMALKFLGA